MNANVPKQINKTVPKLSFWKNHKKFILITGINLLLLAGLIIGLFFGLKKKKNGSKVIPGPPPGTPSCNNQGVWDSITKKCKCNSNSCFTGPSCENSTQKYFCDKNSNDKRFCAKCPNCDQCPPAGAPVNTFLNAPAPSCPSSERGDNAKNWWCRTFDSEESCLKGGCTLSPSNGNCIDSSFCGSEDDKCCLPSNGGTCSGTDSPGTGLCKNDCDKPFSHPYLQGKHCPLYTCDMCSTPASGTPFSADRKACCKFLQSKSGGEVVCTNKNESCWQQQCVNGTLKISNPSTATCVCNYGWTGPGCDQRKQNTIWTQGIGPDTSPHIAEQACNNNGGTTASYEEIVSDTTGFLTSAPGGVAPNWCGQATYNCAYDCDTGPICGAGRGGNTLRQGCFNVTGWTPEIGPPGGGGVAWEGGSDAIRKGYGDCCNACPVNNLICDPPNFTSTMSCGCSCHEGVFCIKK